MRTDSTPGAPERDMSTHFVVIAVISLFISLPVLLLGLVVMAGGLIGGSFVEVFSGVPGLGGLIAGSGIMLGFLIMAFALPGLVAAIGLFQRHPWAKPWAIVVGAISLINVPFGTAFGIYVIWAMTRPEAEAQLA